MSNKNIRVLFEATVVEKVVKLHDSPQSRPNLIPQIEKWRK